MTFSPPLDDDILRETLKVYQSKVSKKAAADALGITSSALTHRLIMATARGLDGSNKAGPQPPGLMVTGVSSLYGPDGELKGQWVKTRGFMPRADMIAEIKTGLSKLPKAILPPAPKMASKDLVTVYPLADLHMGMYAWDEETGNNYDVNIAAELVLSSIRNLLSRVEPSEEGVFLNLGDFFHSDSDENRTRRSGNALDVDTRYARVLRTGVRVAASSVLLMLQRHKQVRVRNIPGNHDPYGALALAVALAETFRDNSRVIVDLNPGPFWFYRFGKVMFAAAHGDNVRPAQMPGIMAAKAPEIWGQSEHRYAFLGHIHQFYRRPSNEASGSQVEIFQTLAPRDAWGNAKGFTAGRSLQAITFHTDRGEQSRYTETVGGQR